MEYAAVALATLGMVLGVAFRLKVLLLFLAVLVIASAAFAVERGWNFPSTLLTIMVVQTIVQLSYFVGILGRSIVPDKLWVRPLL
jgi:hypothetical protein